MMKIKSWDFFLVAIVVLSLLIWMGLKLFEENRKAIHIAFVGPLTGPDKAIGQSMVQALQLYLDDVNRQGGINRRKIVLDWFDDQNDPERAREQAEEIVAQNRAIAVIGHNDSASSIAAGKIYQEYGIPAVSPVSTHVQVTQENEWYFRNAFNDHLQGHFLANYANKQMQQYTVSIIYSETDYDAYLAEVFEQTSRDLNIEIKYKWALSLNNPLEPRIQEIVEELKNQPEAGLIFLATHVPEGIKLVKSIKEAGIKNPLIAPDAFASKSFSEGFKTDLKEGFVSSDYTDGIYVSTPFLLDTANRYAQRFNNSVYKEEYQEDMPWQAFFAIDAAMVILKAIEKTQVKGQSKTLVQDRKHIKNMMATFNKPERAIKGSTGLNYFDDTRNASKSPLMGVYKDNHLISTFNQLSLIPHSPEELEKIETEFDLFDDLKTDSEAQSAQKSAFENWPDEGQPKDEQKNPDSDTQPEPKSQPNFSIPSNKYGKTHVVYTGIQLNDISQFETETITYALDFYLWFRFQGNEINPQQIEFLNAIGPISLTPKANETIGVETYQLYQVKGKFKENVHSVEHALFSTQHPLGVSFRHKTLTREQLIYVTDVLGMELTKENALFEKIKEIQKLSDLKPWRIERVDFFQASVTEEQLGNPRLQGNPIEYSTFNAEIWIGTNNYFYHALIPDKFITEFFVFTLVMTLLLIFLSYQESKSIHLKYTWIFQVIFVFLLLISTEVFVESWITEDVSHAQEEMIVTLFQLLWWIIPAILLNMAIERFLWIPLEEKTDRYVPNLVRLLVSSLIFLLATLGIVGFVFQQAVTSLLATSGVVAMIVGLGIQVNLANIFSGIGLSIERSFRIGDWVKIGEFEEGKVININWRVTQIQTRKGYILNLPNSTVSTSDIYNFTHPDNQYRLRVTIPIATKHDPRKVEEILLNAINSVSKDIEIVEDFTPLVWLETIEVVDVSEWAFYVVLFKTEDYSRKYRILKQVWKQIWIHLNEAGIIPATQEPESEEENSEEENSEEENKASLVELKPVKIFKAKELQKMTF
jgi:potassium-dependent mechanosensitive channel